MSTAFELNHDKLAADPRFADVARELDRQSPIDSSEAFNRYCRTACRIWSEQFGDGIGKTSQKFDELLIRVERGGDDVIRTGWGWVVITSRQDPRIEKFLIVREGKYLALEKHEQKDEHLEVREGAGLILWRSSANEPLRAELLSPGDQFHFVPGMEHCLIGTEDLLVFERSIDPKGMDQDLVFIYEPE
jgi:mannose-6-phosphate isomerase-like protein (cupin superfamily)